MSTDHLCPVCGEIYVYRCNACYRRYQEDIRAGIIPPLFQEASDVDFTFDDWLAIRRTEKQCERERMSPEDTGIYVRADCHRLIRCHRRNKSSPQERATQREKDASDAIKRRYSY